MPESDINQQLLTKKLISLCKLKGWDWKIINTRGMCVGLSTYLGVMNLINKDNDFFNFLQDFVAWDENPATLPNKTEKTAENLFNAVQFIQWRQLYLPIKYRTRLENTLDILLGDNAEIAPIKQKFLMAYTFNDKELVATLAKILKPNQITLLSSREHATYVAYREIPSPHYEWYDPEYADGLLQTFTTLEELVATIKRAPFLESPNNNDDILFEDEKDTTNTRLPLFIECLSNQSSSAFPKPHELISEFLKTRNEINEPAEFDGSTALHLAAVCGDLKTIALLKEKGASDKKRDYKNLTPFDWALFGGDLEAVKSLKFYLDVHRAKEDTPLSLVARFGYLDIAKYLFEEGLDNYFTQKKLGFFPLLTAIQQGHLDVLKYFIEEAGISPTDEIFVNETIKITPIYMACARGQLEIVRYLLSKGADIDRPISSGDRPLDVAIQNGHLYLIKFLVENGAPINPTNAPMSKSLTRALSGKHFDVVDYLVSKGEKLGALDGYGNTYLHIFAKSANAEAIKFLINHGLDVNQKNNQNESAIWVAYKRLNEVRSQDQKTQLLESILVLVNNGANVEEIDSKGTKHNLFERALTDQNYELIAELVKNNIDMDPKIVISAYQNGNLGVRIYLETHPIIQFINVAHETIMNLKQEYDERFMMLTWSRNMPVSQQTAKDIETATLYRKGLKELAEKIQENPLREISSIIKEIPEFATTNPPIGKLNLLINELETKRRLAIEGSIIQNNRQPKLK